MCIAIYKPAGKHLTRRTLKNCWDNNNDGGGFMYVEEGRIIIRKEMDNFRDFWKKYQQAAPDSRRVVLHFRISTSGKIDKRNCHPHRVSPRLAFVHNGIINIKEIDGLSDTVTFGKQVLGLLPEGFQYCTAHRYLISVTIGYSKLIIMNSSNQVTIINETQGSWDDEIWFSNGTYKWPKAAPYNSTVNNSTTPYNGTAYSKGHNGTGFNSVTNPAQTPLLGDQKKTEKEDLGSIDVDGVGVDDVHVIDDIQEKCKNCKIDLIYQGELDIEYCYPCARILDKFKK